jgi:hypothetical protein
VSTCAFALAIAAGCGSNAPTAPTAAINVPVQTSANAGGGTGGGGSVTTLNTGAITVPGGGSTNYTCSDLAAQYAPGAEWVEVKLDQAPNGSHTVSDAMLSAGISSGTKLSFNWTANRGVDAVFVKSGSDGHSLYLYTPESTGGTGLTTPSGQDISHVSFCYDVELLVSKTAATTFTRDYDWTIAKSVDQPSITLQAGAQTAVNYSVVATKDAGTDSDWATSGTITVTNPHKTQSAAGLSVASTLSDHGTMAVSCPLGSLAPQASMTCTYGPVNLASGKARINTASADSTTYGIVAGEGTSAVTFATPTTVRDNAVNVTDTYSGAAVLATGLTVSRTFTYPRPIQASQLACGPNAISNTASLATDDGVTRTASANVSVTLNCSAVIGTEPPPPPPPPAPATAGCSLSQGYWGSHSSNGPAPYNATWAKIGENTPFYTSGLSYYAQMQVPSKGNAYNILAVQFIAAKLNVLNGAAAPAGVDMTAIDAFFKANTPAQIDALKGNSPVRAQALAWASTLDSYNNGRLNVSKCN